MQVPRFWASASKQVQNPGGVTLDLKCWGWSADHRSEAERNAQGALERLATRVRQGAELPCHYGYGSRALREEIIEELSAANSTPSAIVTRNSYGALILNTAGVLFIDIDVQIPKSPGGFFSKLKGTKTDPFVEAQSKLQTQLEQTGIAGRVYRTAAGFRVMGTDQLYEPGAAETERLMESLGADPSFVKLCRAQRSFRARLTPKPWRCGKPKPPVDFPRENSREENVFEQWLSDYESGSSRWASCHHLFTFGSGIIHQDASPLIELHDRMTRSATNLPLA